MRIQVLGTGCAKCRKLKDNAARAVAAAGIDCEIESVTDLQKILAFDVMMTPALVIDGAVLASGAAPSPARIEGWLRERIGAAAGDARDSGRRRP